MALEGTIDTPIGKQKKTTVLLVGGGLVIIFVIGWYRSRQEQKQAVAIQGEINPATGFISGSPEDIAALQSQMATPGGVGGGGGATSSPGVGFVSNAQWSQAVITYLQQVDSQFDAGPMTAALGKYLLGQGLTDGEVSLVQMAIAVQGLPPVSGPNGFPPSFAHLPNPPPTSNPPPGSGAKPAVPTGFHDTGAVWTNALELHWDPVENATGYVIVEGYTGEKIMEVGNVTTATRRGLIHNGTYFMKIAAKNANGQSDWSPILVAHTKN